MSVLDEFEAFGTDRIFPVSHQPQEGPQPKASPRTIRFEPHLFDDLRRFLVKAVTLAFGFSALVGLVFGLCRR